MRVRSRSNAGTMDSTNACTTFGTGETEDYMVTIAPSTACVAPPNAGTALSSVASACAGTLTNLTLTGNSSGSAEPLAG